MQNKQILKKKMLKPHQIKKRIKKKVKLLENNNNNHNFQYKRILNL